MKLFRQLTVLFLLSLVGSVLSELLPFPFPAGVLCMILLFLLFCLRWAKTDSLQETADFLSSFMALLFVPAGVGLIQYFDLLKTTFFPILLICLISTILTFVATAYTVQLVIRLQEHLQQGGASHE